MQILIALTLQFWSASHSIIMGYQNKHCEGHRKLIYFNISFCKYRTNTHVYWLYLWYQTDIARLFLPYQAATAHCISLRLCEWVCVTVVGLLWLVLWQNSAKILAHVWAVTMHLSAITAQKKEIVFVYKYKKAKKVLRQGSQAFWAFVNQIASADFLFMTWTWRNSEPNTSPRIYRYFMFFIQTVVFSLFFHTLPNLCMSWFTKEKQAYYREVNIALTFNSVHCLLMNHWWSVFKPRFYWS